MEVLAVFQNRTQTLAFSRGLNGYGVKTRIINTPREITSSCGLSVVFASNNLNKAKHLLGVSNNYSFAGFFAKRSVGGRIVFVPVK